ALAAWLPSETLVVLDDPALLEAPPEEAPSAVPLAQVLGRFPRLELPLLQRGGGSGPRAGLGPRPGRGVPGRLKGLRAGGPGGRGGAVGGGGAGGAGGGGGKRGESEDGHALRRRLPGALQGPRRGDPELAGRGLHRASGHGRRGAGGALPWDPAGARSRAVA